MRIYPKVVVRLDVENQSSRVTQIDMIVLHDTESANVPGPNDLRSIANWFDNPAAEASAHVCTDGDGSSGRYVSDSKKAWACVEYNSRSLNIEQIGFASDSQASWFKRRKELRETARWVAFWSKKHHVPLRWRVGNGVCQHSDLGVAGGGHHDCGPGYPRRYVMWKAAFYKLAMKRRDR